jgi:hypothetical protein
MAISKKCDALPPHAVKDSIIFVPAQHLYPHKNEDRRLIVDLLFLSVRNLGDDLSLIS